MIKVIRMESKGIPPLQEQIIWSLSLEWRAKAVLLYKNRSHDQGH